MTIRTALFAGVVAGTLAMPSLAIPAPEAQASPGCGTSDRPVVLQTLMEKTVFGVDVLWLSVRIDGPYADSLHAVSGMGRTPEREERAALLGARAPCAVSRLDFVRDVSLDRFVGGIRDSSQAALEAGFIEASTFRTIDDHVEEWYAFLEGRGVAKGDRMTYRIRGDTLSIRYRTADGELLLDRIDVGEAEARSVLAGYFAPGSDFRNGLLDELFESGDS